VAEESSSTVGISEAKSAVLAEIVRTIGKAQASHTKELALAYRLLAGGAQPGSSVVDSK